MVTWQTDLKFDGASGWIQRPVGFKTYHAGWSFMLVDLYGIFDSKKLVEKLLGHCERWGWFGGLVWDSISEWV